MFTYPVLILDYAMFQFLQVTQAHSLSINVTSHAQHVVHSNYVDLVC